MLAFDLAKAFDRVSHFSILSCLKNIFSCSPRVIKFVHSFLSNRLQRVISSSLHVTPWVPVTSGVPQGSVLGPLLFALLVSDFPALSANSRLIAYADDFVLLHNVDSGTSDNLQTDVNTFVSWLLDKKIFLNVDKCKLITFSRSVPASLPSVTISDSLIHDVEVITFLGVILQSNLKWDSHFRLVNTRVSRNMYIVKSLWSHNAPSDVLWQAYMAYVFNVLAYCWPALCDYPISFIKKLLLYEKRACKWSSRVFSQSSLTDRLDRICIKSIMKIVRFYDVHPLKDFFSFREPMLGIRHVRRLWPKKIKKQFFNKSFIRYSSCT